MSEVSLETESGKTSPEDPQMDCEEADKEKEGLSEDLKQESANDSSGGEDTADVMYEINIDDEENAEVRDKDVQEEDEGAQNKSVVSVASGGHETKHVETTETPEENGDSHPENKVTFKPHFEIGLLTSLLCSILLLQWPSVGVVVAVSFLFNQWTTLNLSLGFSSEMIYCGLEL